MTPGATPQTAAAGKRGAAALDTRPVNHVMAKQGNIFREQTAK